MARKRTKELRDPNSYVTFDDIVALALARTNTTLFDSDPNKWQEVLHDICERYKDRIEELKTMFFDESRSDLPPQTDDFYQLLSILSASRLISLPNPSFEHIKMDADQKRRVRDLEEKSLERYRDYVGEIAEMLEGKLAAGR